MWTDLTNATVFIFFVFVVFVFRRGRWWTKPGRRSAPAGRATWSSARHSWRHSNACTKRTRRPSVLPWPRISGRWVEFNFPFCWVSFGYSQRVELVLYIVLWHNFLWTRYFWAVFCEQVIFKFFFVNKWFSSIFNFSLPFHSQGKSPSCWN